MSDLMIMRFAYTPQGTFGEMSMPNDEKIFTVEQPWRDNQQNKSCIPEGIYPCKPRFYNSGDYDAIHIYEVPNRSLILFHKGNNQTDVAGCIAPGQSLSFLEGLWAVGNSTDAFGTLMEHYGDKEFTLTIQGFNPNNNSYSIHSDAENITETRDGIWHPFPGLLERHGVKTQAGDLDDIDYQTIDLSTLD